MADLVAREDLPGSLQARHDELMSSPVGWWPDSLRRFVRSGRRLHCGQELSDRVACWLAEGGDVDG